MLQVLQLRAIIMITVHDPQLCEQLLGFKESPKPSSAISTEQIAGKRTASKPASVSSSISVGSMQRHCSQMIRAQEWLSRKSRRNVMVREFINLKINPTTFLCVYIYVLGSSN